MKESRKAQILLPSVVLGAVLGMSGIASASQTGYVGSKAPGTNAAELAPGDGDNDKATGTATEKTTGNKTDKNVDIDINIDIDGGNGAGTEGDNGNGS
jgi:hypothetical protein